MSQIRAWRKKLKRERVKLIMRSQALIERNGQERDRIAAPALGKRAGGLAHADHVPRASKLKETVLKHGWRCLRCGREDWLTIDHVLPKSQGGKSTMDNAQILCYPCNQWKGVERFDFRGDPPLGRAGWEEERPVLVLDEVTYRSSNRLNKIGATLGSLVREVDFLNRELE